MTPSLFVNDGSFLERFKQLQEEKEKEKGTAVEESRLGKVVSGNLTIGKTSAGSKANDTRKTTHAASGGKLAFSLKQKSKIVAPAVKLGADEDEDGAHVVNVSGDAPTKRQKLGQPDAAEESSGQVDVGNYYFYAYPLVLLNHNEVLCFNSKLFCINIVHAIIHSFISYNDLETESTPAVLTLEIVLAYHSIRHLFFFF